MTVTTFAAIELFMVFMMCFILYASMTTYHGNLRHKQIFPIMILMNMACLISDAVSSSLAFRPVFVSRILDFFLIVPFYAIEFLFYEYIEAAMSEPTDFTRNCRRVILILCIIASVFWIGFSAVTVSGFPALPYFLGQIPGWIIIILTVVTIFRYRGQFDPQLMRSLILYVAIPVIAMTMRNFRFNGNVQHIGISISLLFLHLFVHRRQSEHLREQAIMLEQNRNLIVLSQIKPHFIYNSLNTIYYLCEKDSSLAQESIVEFSEYLRGNLDTIGSDTPVPFSQELEHIHHYLYLEQLRFAEELNVIYDIQNKDFKVPPLSVQLAVENAVKHGIGRKTGGGTVTIASTADEENNIVTVTDDGVGFDMSVLNNQSGKRRHIGIQNMIFRIETISSGTVDIKSAPGEGTCVTIRIPRKT